jgi:hypothetical protein
MSRSIITLAAVSAIALAAPAAAQSSTAGVQTRINQLQTNIQAGVQNGMITRSEAQTLREQLRQLRQIERQYSLNGLSGNEREDLNNRIRTLRQHIRFAARNDDLRGNRYGQAEWIDRNRDGYDDRDTDRDGRWDDNVRGSQYGQADWIDRNRDGYDDRDYDRDGRLDDDGYYGQGGPYDEVSQVCADRGGIGGLIDRVLGGDNCLSIGERVPSGLSALPYELRDDFRDGNGFYHRYYDGNVIQVDARTQTVVRIYDVDD